MKKISFSERYGIQQAVLNGTKTMTRRIVPAGTLRMAKMEVDIHGGDLADRIKDHSLYLWRDEVAVAQCYEECWKFYQQQWESPKDPSDWRTAECLDILVDLVGLTPGWNNKMFVRADLMPHRIRITDIRVERLQNISDKDCLREGIRKSVVEYGDKKIVQWTYFDEKRTIWSHRPHLWPWHLAAQPLGVRL